MEPVITLTSDPFSMGEAVSEEVCRTLGWPLVADEVFDAAARRAGEDAPRIREAIRQPPSFLGMSAARRKRLLACLGAAICEAVKSGGIVYRGPAGHHFIRGVSHVVRVKVTADLPDRAARKAEAEGGKVERAQKDLAAEDEGRMRSCQAVFGEDCGDPVLYDLLLSTSAFSPGEAAAEVVRTAGEKRYRPQTWSIAQLRDLALAWEIRAAISRLDTDPILSVDDGRVELRTRASESSDSRLCEELRGIVMGLPGVKGVTVTAAEHLFGGRGGLLR